MQRKNSKEIEKRNENLKKISSGNMFEYKIGVT
jgi:hypothetical protein